MNGEMGQVRTTLVENLKELHLPAMRGCFEETARRAEKETLSYEQYLLELAQRECEERRRKRIGKLLKESGLPLEKSLAPWGEDGDGQYDRTVRAETKIRSFTDNSAATRSSPQVGFSRTMRTINAQTQ